MSLFGNFPSKKEESKESPPRGGGGGGLFGNQQAQSQTGGLFGNSASGTSPTKEKYQESPSFGGGGGLFGNQQAQATSGSLFGNSGNRISPIHGGGGLFGNKPAQPLTGGLFASGSGGTGGGLFGSHALQNQLPYYQPPEKLTNVYYGKGTLGFNFCLTTNREGILLSSITCAFNADKNKTLEELRAEDYELMKSGKLPEDIKLKLTQRRGKLGLPAPNLTPKGDPRVLRPSMRSDGSMKSLFLGNKYSDVVFKVGNESIPAHKNVLGLCSQHFDNLFSKHESNTIPLLIEIPNAQPEAFKAILEYLYCGEVSLHEKLAAEILILAPRFDLDDLVARAEDFLIHDLSVDNYLRMLEISDRSGSKSLRKQVWTFIIKNMKVIGQREDFEKLSRHLTELMENAIIA